MQVKPENPKAPPDLKWDEPDCCQCRGKEYLKPLDFSDVASVLSEALTDFWEIGTLMDELEIGMQMEANGYLGHLQVEERLRLMAVRLEKILDKWERYMDMVMA